jgi:hypothetical protein
MKYSQGVALFVLATALFSVPVSADTVLINSQDWIDVYSGMLFGRFQGYETFFITSKRHASILETVLPPEHRVQVFESERVPYRVNVAGVLKKLGYETEVTYSGSSKGLNLQLAKQSGLTSFIVVDPTYGYNAVVAASLALSSHAFVLFADQGNAEQVAAFLRTLPQTDSVLLYGQVSPAVSRRLASFSPQAINTGNRYKDNVEALKKYFQMNPAANQVVLTSGEFLENQVIGGEPVILIGRERVLQETVDFVKNTRVKTAVVVGNDLTKGAKQFKDATGISTFVKVGQGIPHGVNEYEPIRALDMFFLPSAKIEVDLAFVQYNALEKVLEVVYRNNGSRAALLGTVTILADGVPVQTVGDTAAQILERNETRGFRYAADLSEEVARKSALVADVFTTYGESAESQDRALAAQVPISTSDQQDGCELELGKVAFDQISQRLAVTLRNPSDVDCFASVALLDMVINDQRQTIAYPGTAKVTEDSKETFRIKQRMTGVDIADNEQVRVRVLYGMREGLLFKSIDATVPLEQTGSYKTYVIGGIIAVLIILVIVLLVMLGRARKKQKQGN